MHRPSTHYHSNTTPPCLTVDILEELWLVKEFWNKLFLVRPTFVNIGPCTGDGEKLTVSKIKPVKQREEEVMLPILKVNC